MVIGTEAGVLAISITETRLSETNNELSKLEGFDDRDHWRTARVSCCLVT